LGKVFDAIDHGLAQWIAQQHLFFVATAPLSATGHVNCSPKGGDTLRVLGPREVAYLDGAGSGIETVAHLRENGRMVLMFCAFDGPPRIVRLHGTGSVIIPGHSDFGDLLAHFAPFPTVRAIIRLAVERVSDSCGYGVPRMAFREDREDSKAYLRKSSDQALQNYLLKNNQSSIDGLPALSVAELENVVIRHE
jgi:hypothetical protein